MGPRCGGIGYVFLIDGGIVMILSCQNISKAFLEKKVLENISFHIENNEKAAIVGINGAGKTTLLRIIVGEMAPDSGTVTLSKGRTLGYLAQDGAVDTANTIDRKSVV